MEMIEMNKDTQKRLMKIQIRAELKKYMRST